MGWLSFVNQGGIGNVIVFPLATALPDGRWYWEVRYANGDSTGRSVHETARVGLFDAVKAPGGDLGGASYSWGWRADGTNWTSGQSTPYGIRPSGADDIVSVAVDTANRSVWFGLNGSWFEGDPASGQSPAFSELPSLVMPALSSTHGAFGTLHQYVPTAAADLRYAPPEGYQPFVPGAHEFLPRPMLYEAKPRTTVSSIARRVFESVTEAAGGKRISESPGRLERSSSYREQARDFFDKGNLLLAQKLALQTLACDPSDQEAREMVEWFHLEPGGSHGSSDGADLGEERLFDFVYIPTEKCGSSAHVTLLAFHPESTVPTTGELQGALNLNAEKDLLSRYRLLVFNRRPELKVGLVMDSRISGARQQPSGLVTGPEFAQRLSRVVRSDGFVHAVRHPFRIVRSTYNSNLIQHLCGDYSFAFLDPDTLFSNEAQTIDAVRSKLRKGPLPVLKTPDLDPDRLKDHFDFAIRMPRPYSIGKPHADHFGTWRVIDLDRAARDKTGGRLSESYRALGIRDDFEHVQDQFPHRDMLHFAMLRNGMRINMFGVELPVYLGRALQTCCYNSDDLIEICWSEPDDACREVGLSSTLCLSMHTNNWRSLSSDTRRHIANSGKLERFFREVFIPSWVSEYKNWRVAIQPLLMGDIDDDMGKRMLVGVREEAEAFLKIHPDVTESWPDVVAML